MGNYLELKTRVNRRVIDLPAAVQAEVPLLVNIAMQKLQEKHNFKAMEGEFQTVTLVGSHALQRAGGGPSSVQFAQNPSFGFKEWRGEPWFLRYQDGAPRFMSWAPSREAVWGMFTQGGATVTDASFPRLLLEEMPNDTQGSMGISVYPIPDGMSDWPDGEYRITVPHFTYLPALSADADFNWFTNQASGEEFIVTWAAGKAFQLNWDFQKYALMLQEAETHYKDLVTADKRMRLGAVREWVPHWQGVHSSKTRI